MIGQFFADSRVGLKTQQTPITSVSVSVHILANNAYHASAHGGLSANVLSDICLSFLEMILLSCLKLCLT